MQRHRNQFITHQQWQLLISAQYEARCVLENAAHRVTRAKYAQSDSEDGCGGKSSSSSFAGNKKVDLSGFHVNRHC